MCVCIRVVICAMKTTKIGRGMRGDLFLAVNFTLGEKSQSQARACHLCASSADLSASGDNSTIRPMSSRIPNPV